MSVVDTFEKIVEDAEATRHEVYMLGVPAIKVNPRTGAKEKKIRLFRAPAPLSASELARQDAAENERIKTAERKDRAEQMARIFAVKGASKQLEDSNTSITDLLEKPKHVDGLSLVKAAELLGV